MQRVSGWAGADATKTTLANDQRALSRATLATRTTEGGVNLHTAAQASETSRIDNFAGNCTCDRVS